MQTEHVAKQPLVARPSLWIGIGGAVASLILLVKLSDWAVEWLWMTHLGYASVFWRIRLTQLALFASVFASVFLYAWLNLRLLRRNAAVRRAALTEPQTEMPDYAPARGAFPRRWFGAATMAFGLLLALLFGLLFAANWDTYIRYRWAQAFAQTEPVFQRDLGFYLFRLPFYELLQNGLLALALVVLAGMVLAYAALGVFNNWRERRGQIDRTSSLHLAVNLSILLGAWAWGYYLDRFQLLYSTRGVVYGAGYTDVTIVNVALWVMLVASALLGLVVWLERQKPRLLGIALGSYVGLHVLMLVVVPAFVQKFIVQPNELELETPYLTHNIAFTRRAYGLDQIQERAYAASPELTFAEVMQHQPTLRNIRLWDWRPLIQTYRQLQAIRLYYQFYDVDVDRYHLDGDYRQVMLSARELADQLPGRADTWVNRHLQYTHGYGLAMNLVSQEGEEGIPQFLIKDLPPVTSEGLTVTQPAIYYGEHMSGHRVVQTKIKEFHYPKGDDNVYTSYDGRGGLVLDAWWKKLLLAWNRFDINIILSSYPTPDSRIQLWRPVRERVSRIAPFLQLDRDPYLVLSEGRLYWIQDAYTVSTSMPYSEPHQGGLSYIRNAVKIVVDAYHGSVDFYVIDPADPVFRVYRDAFPALFKALEDMPPDLQRHLRYPQDLFVIQVDKYRSYHMTIPQVFYNNEDLWTLPQEKYAGDPIPMAPYYILMRLPGEEQLQFLLTLPLTPSNKDNMIAWMAAKADSPDYGQVILFKLPKERLISGPIQIEARIDQDPLISRRLSLWDQRGSRVIRGNLLVIPINHSFLYVEPVYLIAEGTNIPQLRRVIVAHGDRVAMEPTLAQAIRVALEGQPREERRVAPEILPDELSELRSILAKTEQALQRGDWAAFGNQMATLKELLGE